MNSPQVSVACVVYNQEKYIKDCLDSLVCQITDFDYEIIVHDDASTDATPDIIRQYEKKYPKLIKPVYEEENLYSKDPGKLRDLVYSKMTGKYFAFVEGDDYWCDNRKLQKQFDALERHKDCTMCAHKTARIREDGSQIHSIIGTNRFSPGRISGDAYIKGYFTDGEAFQTSSYFIKRDIILSMPLSIRNAFYVGDIPMLLWSMVNGNMYYIDSVSSCYRVMSENSTNQALRNKEYAVMRLRKSIEGNMAFDQLTGHKYWEYMKHEVMIKKAQVYFADRKLLPESEMKGILAELGWKEKVTARIKFTWLGNILRNVRKDLNSRF